jgi:protein SCO1/2
MKTISLMFLLLIAPFICGAQPATGALSDETLMQIKFDQKLGNQVSMDLPFRDEHGNQIKLGQCFADRPVILVLGYYRCPMLCSLTLNGLIEAMQDLRMDVGRQFDIINVSIDPNETPALAAAKKRTYVKRYGREGAAAGWHFLTGEEPVIHKLADEVGFRYAYDPASKQFAHPSGVVILTPDGRIAHYIFGVTYSPNDLNAALRDAGIRRIGSPIQQFFLLCFHYSPLTGKYGALIMGAVRVSGVAILAVLSCLVLRSRPGWNRRRKEADE